MILKANTAYNIGFAINDATGLAVDADPLPTASVYSDTTEIVESGSVTVAKITGEDGCYTASFTTPESVTLGQTVKLLIKATVDTIASKAFKNLGLFGKTVGELKDETMRGTNDANTTIPDNAGIANIKAKTDKLSFSTGDGEQDIKATLDGEEVVTDSASRTASKADVSGLATPTNITAGTITSVTNSVNANLVSILGTALAETSGYIAGAFKKFFNIETPIGTVNSIPATGNWNTVEPDNAGISEIKDQTDQLDFSGTDGALVVEADLSGVSVSVDEVAVAAAIVTALDNSEIGIACKSFGGKKAVWNDTDKTLKVYAEDGLTLLSTFTQTTVGSEITRTRVDE